MRPTRLPYRRYTHWGEYSTRATGRDRQRHGQNLCEGKKDQRPADVIPGHRFLNPAVSGRDCFGDNEGEQSHQEPANRGLYVIGNFYGSKQIPDAVKDRRFNGAHEASYHSEYSVTHERNGLSKMNGLRKQKYR